MGGVDVFNQRLISDFAADYLEARAQTDQAKYGATPLGNAAAWQVSKEQALQIQKIRDELVGAKSSTSQMIANGSHRVET